MKDEYEYQTRYRKWRLVGIVSGLAALPVLAAGIVFLSFTAPIASVAAAIATVVGASLGTTEIVSYVNMYKLGLDFQKLVDLLNKSYQMRKDYLYNINILMEASGIKEYEGLPYLGYIEKAIYNKLCLKGDDLKKNWKEIFGNVDYLAKLDGNNQDQFIKIVKSVSINYQIRELLNKGSFFGIIGQSKSGKSTFLEKLLPGEFANATARVPTTEIKPFEIVDGVTILDYPHFESTDINHKLQFLFSRFLLDYVFFVCSARDRTDLTSIDNFLNLANFSFNNRFNVLLNPADTVWRENKNGEVTYSTDEINKTKEKVIKKLNDKSADRVYLSCLNYDHLDADVKDKLKTETEIKTIKDLRIKVFDQIIDANQNSETKDLLKKKINEYANKSFNQKSILIKNPLLKRLNTLNLHLINGIQCEHKGGNHIDVANNEELIKELEETFEMKNIVLRAERDNSIDLRTYEDIMKNDYHTFTISGQCNRRVNSSKLEKSHACMCEIL